MVSSENLEVVMGVSKPLLGSLVTLTCDIASQKSVWLTVAKGALIVKYRSSYFRPGVVRMFTALYN